MYMSYYVLMIQVGVAYGAYGAYGAYVGKSFFIYFSTNTDSLQF